MTDTLATTAAEPDGAPRIASLDVLRGIAILGILFMNIDGMGAAAVARDWALLIGDWTILDRVIWFARQVLADGTARCMLEMLFGAGMVILTGRGVEKAGWWPTMRAYYWRNIVLFAFGMVHVFGLLWYGDILHMYALCAMIVFPLRKLPARWLLTLGLLYAVALGARGIPSMYLVAVENTLVADAAEHRAAGQPISRTERKAVQSNAGWHRRIRQDRLAITREDRNRKAGFARWRMQQVETYTSHIPRVPLAGLFWFGEVTCMMVFGAGLFKLGILQGQRSRGFYARMWFLGYLVGGPLRAIGTWQTMQFGDGVSLDWGFHEVGRIAMTLGHIGLINLLLSTVRGRAILNPFAAAGRTALTLYICQTLICLWLLYPPFALGLYDTQGWAALMATAVVVNALLLVAANWWVRHFTIAPVEWAWRSIAAWRVLPFGRIRAA